MFQSVRKASRVFDNCWDNDSRGCLRAGDSHKDKTHGRVKVLVDRDRGGLARPRQRDFGLEQEVLHG